MMLHLQLIARKILFRILVNYFALSMESAPATMKSMMHFQTSQLLHLQKKILLMSSVSLGKCHQSAPKTGPLNKLSSSRSSLWTTLFLNHPLLSIKFFLFSNKSRVLFALRSQRLMATKVVIVVVVEVLEVLHAQLIFMWCLRGSN